MIFPRAKLVVVMVHALIFIGLSLNISEAGFCQVACRQVLMPLILNVFALWTADSFLQALMFMHRCPANTLCFR